MLDQDLKARYEVLGWSHDDLLNFAFREKGGMKLAEALSILTDIEGVQTVSRNFWRIRWGFSPTEEEMLLLVMGITHRILLDDVDAPVTGNRVVDCITKAVYAVSRVAVRPVSGYLVRKRALGFTVNPEDYAKASKAYGELRKVCRLVDKGGYKGEVNEAHLVMEMKLRGKHLYRVGMYGSDGVIYRGGADASFKDKYDLVKSYCGQRFEDERQLFLSENGLSDSDWADLDKYYAVELVQEKLTSGQEINSGNERMARAFYLINHGSQGVYDGLKLICEKVREGNSMELAIRSANEQYPCGEIQNVSREIVEKVLQIQEYANKGMIEKYKAAMGYFRGRTSNMIKELDIVVDPEEGAADLPQEAEEASEGASKEASEERGTLSDKFTDFTSFVISLYADAEASDVYSNVVEQLI